MNSPDRDVLTALVAPHYLCRQFFRCTVAQFGKAARPSEVRLGPSSVDQDGLNVDLLFAEPALDVLAALDPFDPFLGRAACSAALARSTSPSAAVRSARAAKPL